MLFSHHGLYPYPRQSLFYQHLLPVFLFSFSHPSHIE